jgi:hypothetical protein
MGFLGVIRGALFTQDNTIALNEVQEQLALLTIELSRACELNWDNSTETKVEFKTQAGTEAAVSRTLNAPSGVTFSYDENKKTVTISMDVTMGDDQTKTFSTTIAPYKLVSKQGCI